MNVIVMVGVATATAITKVWGDTSPPDPPPTPTKEWCGEPLVTRVNKNKKHIFYFYFYFIYTRGATARRHSQTNLQTYLPGCKY